MVTDETTGEQKEEVYEEEQQVEIETLVDVPVYEDID